MNMKKSNEFDSDKGKTTSMDTSEVKNEGAPRVNTKDKALALIRKELAKKGVWHTENEVEDVIDSLYEVYEADGTVPTREAFAERCANEEVAQTVLGMGSDPFTKKKLGKNGIIAICAGCVLAVALIGGVWWAVTTQPQDASDTGSAATSVSEKKDADGQGTSDDADKADAADEDATATEDATGTEEAAKEGGGKEGGDTAAQGGGADKSQTGNGGSTSSSGNGGNGGSASKPSGGSTGGSGNSTQTQQPSHTHNWVPVTKTVHHDAQYKTVHHDAVTQERTICNNCGADITGNVDAHMKANIMNGCGSYSVKTVVVQQAYDEQVLVSNAWDETVTTGYRCSTCGATK